MRGITAAKMNFFTDLTSLAKPRDVRAVSTINVLHLSAESNANKRKIV